MTAHSVFDSRRAPHRHRLRRRLTAAAVALMTTVGLGVFVAPAPAYAAGSISGNTGISDVQVRVVEGVSKVTYYTTSDANGNYSIGVPRGIYILTPSKPGVCSFAPRGRVAPVEDGSHVTGKNFTPVFNCSGIQGNTGRIAGITVRASDEFFATSDANGDYRIVVPPGTYMVFASWPEKPLCAFHPHFNNPVTVGSSDLTGVNFNPVCAFIQGNVGIAGHHVEAVGNPGRFTGTSDANGDYSIAIPGAPNVYAVTPAATGCLWSPPSRTVSTNTYGANGVWFNHYCKHISGFLDDGSDDGLQGATVVLQPSGRSTISNATGRYRFADVPAGTHTLTPSKPGCTFRPASRSFTIDFSTPAESSLGFEAFCGSISGNVGVAGVRVNATSSAGSLHAVSDAAGNYRIGKLSSQETYAVTPASTCGGFAPASRRVTIPDAGAHVTGVSFTPRQCVHGNVKVAGATITATAAGHPTRTATSAADGSYTLPGLDRNTAYRVKVTRAGGCPFTPSSRPVTIAAADVQPVNFDTVCAHPNNAAFWTLGTSGLSTRAALLNRAAAQACRNGYYPQYFCRPALSSLERKMASIGEVVPKSHPNPDAGCSTPLESLPRVGIWAQGGAGVDNLWFRRGCDNHDQCYQHGFDPAWDNETWGADGTKNQCDIAWKNDNARVCANLFNPTEGLVCAALAEVYIAAVLLGGAPSYHRDKNTSLTGGGTLRCSPELSNVETVGSHVLHHVVHTVPRHPDTHCQPLRLDFIFPEHTVITTQYRAVRFSVPGGLATISTNTGVYGLCPRHGGHGGECNGTLVVDFETPVDTLYVRDVLASTSTGKTANIRVYSGSQFLGQVPLYDGTTANLSHLRDLGRITRIEIDTIQATVIDWIQFTRDPGGK